MLKTLAGLVAELRAVGIPVSPTEHIDAASALKHTALEDRAAVRAALATTLVKNSDHLRAFATVFDLISAPSRVLCGQCRDAGRHVRRGTGRGALPGHPRRRPGDDARGRGPA